MNARTKKPNLHAVAAYENAHMVALDLLERINELLHDRPAPDDHADRIGWDDVGTTNEVNHRLSAVVALLSGTEK